ncbi:MAG: class I SAM-dependent methyltransferase [Pseudomonadota bacterium]
MRYQDFYTALPENVRSLIPAEADCSSPLDADDWMINAVYSSSIQQLAEPMLEYSELFDDESLRKAKHIVEICVAMAAASQRLESSVIDKLGERGISARPSGEYGQHYVSSNLYIDQSNAIDAVDALVLDKFVCWHPWDNQNPTRSVERMTSVMLTSLDQENGRVKLQWAEEIQAKQSWVQKVRVRIGRARTGVVENHFGPFLATPDSLVGSLLEVAEAGTGDTVADLGCGNGRFLISVVQKSGAKGIGIESDPVLANAAISNVMQAGLSDLIHIEGGDLRNLDLQRVDVVLLFLPVSALRKLIPELKDRLSAGARIVAHEQRALKKVDIPDRSELIVTSEAFSVAHRWNIS